jgi:fused signal recognition particle receptor
MTLVIVLIVVAVLLVTCGALVVGTRSRRRGVPLQEAGPPQPRAPKPSPVPAVAAAPGPDTSAVTEAPAGRPALKDRLGRARGLLAGYFDQVRGRKGIDEATFEELEEALILADVGVPTTTRVLDDLRDRLRTGALAATDPTALLQALRDDLTSMFEGDVASLAYADGDRPTVWLFVGVNGVGKTTTIGKLALRETQAGRAVVLAAGDTFRAAAGEQLESWAERAGARIVRGSDGADPSSVIFDAVQHAASRGAGLVLADTAGRLHTKVNLMDELRKVRRVAERPPGQLTEVLLVLDATTGQNGVAQARQFTEAVGVTGIVLTKLDGTAKGGVVLAIRSELGLPIKLVGVGEGSADLVPFDPAEFVAALFG